MHTCLVFLLALLLTPLVGWCQTLLAFPSAEGFGRFAQGGRGGVVLHVKNLNASGPDSFLAAVQDARPRTIVFDVSGATQPCTQDIYIQNPFVTIAGQTAPSPGFTLECPLLPQTHDVIIRHLRITPGNSARHGTCGGSPCIVGDDLIGILVAGGGSNVHDIIVDHSSVTWAADDSIGVNDVATNITFQWSITAEGIINGGKVQSPASKGFSMGSNSGGGTSFHHNIITSQSDRNPFIHGANLDFVNNLVYNWGIQGNLLPISGPLLINFVGNYYLRGPGSPGAGTHPVDYAGVGGHSEVTASCTRGTPPVTCVELSSLYRSGNIEPVSRPNDGLPQGDFFGDLGGSPAFPVTGTRLNYPMVTTTTADQAKTAVLATTGAGASVPVRSATDIRLRNEINSGTGQFISDDPSEVGGYPPLAQNVRPANFDTDGDGIPDMWENDHGLNPTNAADGAAVTADGYTNLEHYLNELAGDTAAPPPQPSQVVFTTQPVSTPAGQTMPAVVVQAQDVSGNLSSGFSDNIAVVLSPFGMVPRAQMTLVSVDTQEAPTYQGTNAIDGQTTTFWNTQFTAGQTAHPHTIIVNLGGSASVTGFTYLPRQDGSTIGNIAQYRFYVGADGTTWDTTPQGQGTLTTSTQTQTIATTAKTGAYVKLVADSDTAGSMATNVAELRVLTASTTSGTLAGNTTRTAQAGQATFDNLSLTPAGTYALQATSTNLASAISASFAITGGPTHLRFTGQPQTVLPGQTLPAITVQFEDAANNLFPTTQAIDIALGANPGGSTLAGTRSRAPVGGNGIVTFNDLSLNQPGVGYTLVASVSQGAITGDTSTPFTILSGVPNPFLSGEWVAHGVASHACAATGGDTNVSDATPGVDHVHTLTCPLPANLLKTGAVLESCALIDIVGGGTSTRPLLKFLLGGVTLVENGPSGTLVNQTTNSWMCFQTVIAGPPGPSVSTYSSYVPSQPSAAASVSKTNQTVQPVNIATNSALTAAFASQWPAGSPAGSSLTLHGMVFSLSQ